MVTIDGAKMSKSAGNFITLDQLFSGDHPVLDRGYSPMVVRFLMLQSHYRSKIDFSNEALEAAEKGYRKLLNAYDLLDDLSVNTDVKEGVLDAEITEQCDLCYERMSDDFNTAQVLAALFELVSKINAIYNNQVEDNAVSASVLEKLKTTFNLFVTDLLGLTREEEASEGKTDSLVQLLIEIRANARANKDFETSDKIRDDLSDMGIVLKDDKSGKTTFEIK